jgi:hypothetical protein
MNIRSCELQTHLYAHQILIFLIDYTRECGYDEPLFDSILIRHTECDTIGRCPMNSYCNAQTNRCCIKGKIRDNLI